MNPNKESVYETLEELANSEAEKEQVEQAKRKERVKEAYQGRKLGVFVAIATTALPFALATYSHYFTGHTYQPVETLFLMGVALAGWVYFAHKRVKLQDARNDYYNGTEVFDEWKGDNE